MKLRSLLTAALLSVVTMVSVSHTAQAAGCARRVGSTITLPVRKPIATTKVALVAGSAALAANAIYCAQTHLQTPAETARAAAAHALVDFNQRAAVRQGITLVTQSPENIARVTAEAQKFYDSIPTTPAAELPGHATLKSSVYRWFGWSPDTQQLTDFQTCTTPTSLWSRAKNTVNDYVDRCTAYFSGTETGANPETAGTGPTPSPTATPHVYRPTIDPALPTFTADKLLAQQPACTPGFIKSCPAPQPTQTSTSFWDFFKTGATNSIEDTPRTAVADSTHRALAQAATVGQTQSLAPSCDATSLSAMQTALTDTPAVCQERFTKIIEHSNQFKAAAYNATTLNADNFSELYRVDRATDVLYGTQANCAAGARYFDLSNTCNQQTVAPFSLNNLGTYAVNPSTHSLTTQCVVGAGLVATCLLAAHAYNKFKQWRAARAAVPAAAGPAARAASVTAAIARVAGEQREAARAAITAAAAPAAAGAAGAFTAGAEVTQVAGEAAFNATNLGADAALAAEAVVQATALAARTQEAAEQIAADRKNFWKTNAKALATAAALWSLYYLTPAMALVTP